MGLLSAFRAASAARQGREAWLAGDLDRAIERLEAVRAARPGAADVVFPLARALAERGDDRAALALLEGIPARGPAGEAAAVFRALVLLDGGEPGKARAAVAGIAGDNLLAGAIGPLADLAAARQGDGSAGEGMALAFPPGAVWLPDVAGRLLALLEERFCARDPAEAERYHHRLFTGGAGDRADEGKSAAAEAGAKGAEARKRGAGAGFRKRSEWSRQLGELFEAGRFEALRELWEHPAAAEAWKSLSGEVHYLFALLHCGREAQAARYCGELLRHHPRSADLHFLDGLARIRLGRRVAAGWCFTRAARLADTDIHQIASDLAGRLGV